MAFDRKTAVSEADVLIAAVRLGIAFMTKSALVALVAERRQTDPAATEAALRELDRRYLG
ncbi:hypothetical protein [Roseicyclus sp.]|uniref:hypothetical protein n=1 Tax=Roseicyclus sp. TaxID=1914329 RepID=UPI003FA04A02